MAEAIVSGQNRNRDEMESMEVAESARESDWAHPSFIADLFMGKFRFKSVAPYPFQDPVDKAIGDTYIEKIDAFLRENIDGDEVDETGEIPDKVMKGLAKLGAFGMKIPKEYGGLGLSQVNYNRALGVVMQHCCSTGALLSAHQSIGVPQPLLLFGTEEQRKKYLPRFAKGEISAFALTEPEVGSDPARLSTTATPTPDGKHYILNGTKLWCTNGAIADILVVMAQTPPVVVKGKERKQITAFIVEAKTPGFEVLHRCRFMGLNGVQNALLQFKDVKVPAENVLWGTGKGLKLALVTLNAGRLSIPAAGVGGARLMLAVSREWGLERKQWGNSVGKHEPGAAKIASLSATLFAMDALTWMSGVWVDRKTQDIRIEAAIAKLFCSIRGHIAAEDTLQLRAGRGYERATSLKARGEKPIPVERWVRDSRINQIVEGTNDILRLFVSREALDKHLGIGGVVMNPKLPILARLLGAVKAGAFYAIWYPRQWFFFTGHKYWQTGNLARGFRYVDRTSHRLARATFHCMMRYGLGLEKKQMQLGRLVDIAAELFAMAAALGRAYSGKEPHVREVALVFFEESRERIEASFRAMRCNQDNAHNRLTSKILEGKLGWQEAN